MLIVVPNCPTVVSFLSQRRSSVGDARAVRVYFAGSPNGIVGSLERGKWKEVQRKEGEREG